MSAPGGSPANWPVGPGQPGPIEPSASSAPPPEFPLDAGTGTTTPPPPGMIPEQPGPPRGPGVVPPFAAPPTDGIRRRMWIGLTAGAIALIVVCVGGLGGCIALGLTAEKARTNAASNVVTDFLTAWEHSNYAAAYQLTCDAVRKEVDLADFTGELSSRTLTGFTVGTPNLTTEAAIVPVRLEFAESGFDDERYEVVVNNQNKSLVCGTVP